MPLLGKHNVGLISSHWCSLCSFTVNHTWSILFSKPLHSDTATANTAKVPPLTNSKITNSELLILDLKDSTEWTVCILYSLSQRDTPQVKCSQLWNLVKYQVLSSNTGEKSYILIWVYVIYICICYIYFKWAYVFRRDCVSNMRSVGKHMWHYIKNTVLGKRKYSTHCFSFMFSFIRA